MDLDLLDVYGRASAWTAALVAGASSKMDAPTTCSGWDVHTLMNHMLQTQWYFVGATRGEDVAPPGGTPPDVLSDEPRSDFDRARAETLATFGEPGVIEQTGPALGIAFSDQLLHGWDLALSMGRTPPCPTSSPPSPIRSFTVASPTSNARAFFGPEIAVAPDATAQEKLLAYSGRDPSLAA
jgi:uncharacterized protein (TIGR03086 family)